MIEIGDRASLGQICRSIFRFGDQLGMRHLDGNQPIQLLVMSQIDETKAAFTQHFPDALLMLWSVLLIGCGESQEEKEAAKQNAVAAIKKLGGNVTFDGVLCHG